MQKFPQGAACVPAGHAGVAALGRFVEAANQGRQHVAVGGVVVVSRAIEVGGQLLRRRLRLTQLDAGDFGDRVPRVRGFQRPGEQCFLADRLLGELGINAAAAQKQQAPHAAAPGRFDHIGLDLEVIQQEISRVGAVGLDATHLSRRQHHHRGLVFGKPALHGRWRCLLCHGGRPRRCGRRG